MVAASEQMSGTEAASQLLALLFWALVIIYGFRALWRWWTRNDEE
jgi:hypothetical protein